MRPHLRATGPARLLEVLGEGKLKSGTMSKENLLSLRPKRNIAGPPKEDVPSPPHLCFAIQAREAGAG